MFKQTLGGIDQRGRLRGLVTSAVNGEWRRVGAGGGDLITGWLCKTRVPRWGDVELLGVQSQDAPGRGPKRQWIELREAGWSTQSSLGTIVEIPIDTVDQWLGDAVHKGLVKPERARRLLGSNWVAKTPRARLAIKSRIFH